MAILERFVVNVGGRKTRREKLEGRDCIVAPIALLARGVIPGSKGPVFYDEPDMRASVPAWNHKPIVVYHPKDDAGKPLSGCDPVVLNTRKVGVILNTAYGDRLVTEGWFDVQRTRAVDRRVLTKLEKEEAIESSTGLFVEMEEGAGEFEGEPYVGTARQYAPDHLAVLPDKLGAYPVSKGGGVNYVANEEPEATSDALRYALLTLARRHRLANQGVDNELSFSQKTVRLTDLLRERYGRPGRYWDGCVVEVFDNRVVFCDGDDYTSLKMVRYKVGTDDSVSLDGDAEKVERVVEYRAASGGSYVGNAAGELVLFEETNMAFDKKAHVAALAAAKVGDEAFLNGLADDVLEKLQVPPAPAPVTPPVVNDGDKPPKKMSLQDLLANADDGARETIAGWSNAARVVAEAEAKERDKMVKAVVANGRNKFKEEFLRNCPMEQLRGIASLAVEPKAAGGILNGGPTYELGAGVDELPLTNEAPAVAPIGYN